MENGKRRCLPLRSDTAVEHFAFQKARFSLRFILLSNANSDTQHLTPQHCKCFSANISNTVSSPCHFPHFVDKLRHREATWLFWDAILNLCSGWNEKPATCESHFGDRAGWWESLLWEEKMTCPIQHKSPMGYRTVKTCCKSCSWHATKYTEVNSGMGEMYCAKCKPTLCNSWLRTGEQLKLPLQGIKPFLEREKPKLH